VSTPNTAAAVVAEPVAEALVAGRPVVALESTLIAHGLPKPDNLDVAHRIEQVVRDGGAVPATIGVLDGRVTVGLSESELERLATAEDVAKLSVRDLAVAAALGVDGATTVASTAAVAARTGIAVFATGGLGGVHRPGPDGTPSYDESADLTVLADCPIAVVCAGVKSILDVPATLERLETLSVPVLGYRTDRFPGFYLTDSGHGLDWRVESPEQVAAVVAARLTAGPLGGAVVVAQPLPTEDQLDPEVHDRVLAEALEGLAKDGVTGKAVTPYLLAHFHEATGGRSLEVNTAVILRNAALAAEIAVALSPGEA
jgi:pseudouridine-5'-phosphate glycosidase